jgi:hypothetical protein
MALSSLRQTHRARSGFFVIAGLLGSNAENLVLILDLIACIVGNSGRRFRMSGRILYTTGRKLGTIPRLFAKTTLP